MKVYKSGAVVFYITIFHAFVILIKLKIFIAQTHNDMDVSVDKMTVRQI